MTLPRHEKTSRSFQRDEGAARAALGDRSGVGDRRVGARVVVGCAMSSRTRAHQIHHVIVPLLSVAVIVLVLWNLFAHDVITWQTFKDNKDALSAVQSTTQILVLTLGAVFSYFRFFKGRTFVSRADIDVAVQVIRVSEETNVHVVNAELKNLGAVAIWDPQAELYVSSLLPDDAGKNVGWARTDHILSTTENAVVDSGERAAFTAYTQVLAGALAVRYHVVIVDTDGVSWRRTAIVQNKVDSKTAAAA